MAVLIPCLVNLRAEFDALNPDRDKGADGWIGDSNHSSSSDHTPDEDSGELQDHDTDDKNEVHALDIDSTGPWPDGSFKSLVMTVVEGEKAKWDDPDDKCRLNYVIFDRKIYDKDNDFAARDYTGSDPHTNHAHFSARYETECENDQRPWGLEDDMSWDTIIKLTDSTCEAFGKPYGTEMTASSLLQTVGIHAARSAGDAAEASNYSQQADATLDQLVDPNTSTAQKASVLAAVLGAQAAEVAQQLAARAPQQPTAHPAGSPPPQHAADTDAE